VAPGDSELEVERHKLRGLSPLDQPSSPEELRIRQLRARDMQRGYLEGNDLEDYVRSRLLTTTLDKAVAWARSNAMWPATFGLACCAIEMMSMVSARYDTARYGAEVFRASPRQADMLILSGRVSIKMVPVIRRIYDQMLEPKWVLSMGACSSSGGMFGNYAVVQGADKFLPVDIHIPGCPPRPEALMYGILKLRNKILGEPDLGWRDQYRAHGTEEGARPWGAGGIPVERAGTSPADGLLEATGEGGSHPAVAAAAEGGEIAASEAATGDAAEEAAEAAGDWVREQSRDAAGEAHGAPWENPDA
jgi:NADH-quinone oxidoreductase subunit B